MAATKKTAGTKKETTIKPEKTEQATAEKRQLKDVDMHQYITVRNGAQGRLVYVSPRTNERFVWEEFGDEQEMELQELRNAKAANKKFFERNWFMFDDEFAWVVDYLGVRAFYKNTVGIDDFDDLFKKKPAELEKTLAGLSEGQKRAVNYRARQLIEEGGIGSSKVIEAIERVTGVELLER